MNKVELVNSISEKSGLSKKDSESALTATLETIVSVVASNQKVAITGFGTWEKKIRAARKGHNPKTGEEIDISESTVPKFHAGKAFKDAMK